MPKKLITVSITALVDDHIKAEAVASAMFNMVNMNDTFDCEVELLDSEVTLEVDAED